MQKSIKLNTGASMPLLGLGTFLSKPGEVKEAVKVALSIGYRHIDCAEAYDNQKEVGDALTEVFAEGNIKREDVFITSKLRAFEMTPSGIEKQLDQTLSDLRLSYVDLYLVHQPVACRKEGNATVPQRGFGLQDVWRAIEALYLAGKAKAIGVSNFPTVIINDLLNYAKIKPAVNQIERTPYLVQALHVNFCRANGIEITAYGPLGAPGLMSTRKPHCKALLQNEVVKKIAEKHKKTVAQVLIRWHIEDSIVTIPKSTNAERLKENFNVWDFSLDAADIAAMNALDENLRYFDQDWHTVPTFT